MSINCGREELSQSWNGIPHGIAKEHPTDTCNSKEKSHKCNIEGKRPDPREFLGFHFYKVQR